jgi:hypothetical protein
MPAQVFCSFCSCAVQCRGHSGPLFGDGNDLKQDSALASPAAMYCSWYDGQTWVKPPQMLMRDRLLGSYQVGDWVV